MHRLLLVALACSIGWAGAQDTPSANTAPIEVVAPTADKAIENRIREIFDAVGGFDSISISVQSGVVSLSGEVANASLREDAISLSDRTDGVVLTLDRLTEPAEIKSQFAPAFEKLQEMGRTIVVKLPLIGAALLILLVAWFLTRMLEKHHGWLDRLHFSSLGKQLARRVARLLIYIVAILIALELLDATAIVGAILGAAGLAGLALGFAFKNIVENYLAGVLLSTRNPFEIGDAVEIDGQTGKVSRLTSRDTVLVTLDGNHLRIPNATVMNSVLLNYTRNPRRRFDFQVGVSNDFDLTEVKQIGLSALAKNPALLADPEPIVVIDSLGDSSVVLRFFAWINQTNHDFMKSKSESIRMVKEAYDSAGIEMPEPIYRVNLKGNAPLSDATGSMGNLLSETTEESPNTSAPSKQTLPEDLSVDRTIDEQIEEEQSLSQEENLLPPNQES